MAVDLSVNLAGLKLRNPLVVASADIGRHLGQIKEAEYYGAGAFITKGCIPRTDAAGLSRKGRYRVDLKKGTHSSPGMHRLNLAEAKKLISDAKKEVKIPIAANLFVFTTTEEEKDSVTKAAKELYESGADFIELDSTGNLPGHFGETEKAGKGEEHSDEYFTDIASKYPSFVAETIKSVKEVVDVPVVGKVAYQNLNVPAFVRGMEKAGADIIDIGNTDVGVDPGTLDIYNPKMRGSFESIEGGGPSIRTGVTGEPLRMIAQAHILKSAKILHTPILGCGGIMNWRHVVEAIMCGATATASCSVFMVRGFEVLKEMEDGLRKFMEEQGYSSVEEFKDIFLDQFSLSRSDRVVYDAIARVNPEKCDGCGLCIKPAQCGLERRAISLVDNKAVVNEAQCNGCETCASICPIDAVTMVIKN